jgi:putative transposase
MIPLIKKEKKYAKKKKHKNKLKRLRKKIKNKIDDMHWKTINFLTRNHENIFIGDLSTKSIVNKEQSNLSGSMKKLALRTNMFKFRERLEYKCKMRCRSYQMIDERYTSKMCSNCGEICEDLGSQKILKCKGNDCKKVIDRDVNGARNIYIKTYLK